MDEQEKHSRGPRAQFLFAQSSTRLSAAPAGTLLCMAWNRSCEDTVELPIDALAILVLEDYVAGNGWNWQNWMRESEQYGTAQDGEIGLALSDLIP